MYDRYEVVGGVFNSELEESINFAEEIGIEKSYKGAPFIQNHIIQATEKKFDDFAGSEVDEEKLKKILGLN